MDLDKLSPEDLENGYTADENGNYYCLFCPVHFEADEVFPIDGKFYTAKKGVQLHVKACHPDHFDLLLKADAKRISLTDNQKALLTMFYRGLSDGEIAQSLGLSQSTVRHQRFQFRERAKAAKLFLALWTMANKHTGQQALLPVHEGATMVDERYVITEKESQNILENAFESFEPLRLKHFPAREKKKVAVLYRLAEEFRAGKKYTEKEVNEILKAVYPDFATLRRYLIEYGHLCRTDDCKSYWKNQAGQDTEKK